MRPLRASVLIFCVLLLGHSSAGPTAAAPKPGCGVLNVRVLDSAGAAAPHVRVRFAWDSEGKPVLYGMETITERSLFFQPEQWTDSMGVAACTHCCETDGSYHVEVVADGYAPVSVDSLGRDSSLVVRLGRGAVIRGRVVRDGKPVPNARVNMEGGNETTTEKDGTYWYGFLVPRSSYVFYTPMDHGQSAGGLRSVYVVTGNHDSETWAPDLVAGPVHTLRGILVPPRGTALPSRFMLYWVRTIRSQRGHDDYDERPYLHTGPDGSFEITGLPEQTVRLDLRYTGWKFARPTPRGFRLSAEETELEFLPNGERSNLRIPVVPIPPDPAPAEDSMP